MTKDKAGDVARAWYAIAPPRGAQYEALIDFLVARASRVPQFLLAFREREPRGTAAALLDRLSPHLITEIETNRWPGTELRGQTATLRSFRFNRASGAVLASMGALDAFRAPLPEDLCFLAADGEPWLVSTAREDEYDLHLQGEEPEQLRASLPWLELGHSRRRG